MREAATPTLRVPNWLNGETADGRPFRVDVRALECPNCRSQRKRCLRPSGHDCDWHKERHDLLDAWLARKQAGSFIEALEWLE